MPALPLVLSFLSLFLLIAPAQANEGPSAAKPDRLRFATYNIGNYNACARMTQDGYKKDYPKDEVSKAALRATIGALNADVLALQEMGSAPYLEELRRDLHRQGIDYPNAVLLDDSEDKDRHLAVLSRLPLLQVVPHARLSYKLDGKQELVKRGVLEVLLRTSQGDLSLWIVHLKSRHSTEEDDPDSARRRAAEATAIRELLLERHRDPGAASFLVAGDFNDTKINRPLRAFLDKGKTPLSEMLDVSDSRGEHWTYHNAKDDSYDRIDHILCSPGLLRALGAMPKAFIFDFAEVETASDHRPVFVDLAFARTK